MNIFRSRNVFTFVALSALICLSIATANDLPQSRIIGGNEIDIGDVPTTVAILNRFRAELDGDLYQAHTCGGTVIDSRWVLTAAHCVVDFFNRPISADSLLVLIGSSSLRVPVTQPVAVRRVIVHEDYVDLIEGEDIALLELESDAQVPAIPLDIEPLSTGNEAFIAGWGAQNSGDNGQTQQFAEIIRGASVQMQPGVECAEQYPLIRGLTDETTICAAAAGVDTCQGDSGGPMYRVTEDGNIPYSLTGITSWGIGCANPDAPGVYTNVSSYVDWIIANTGSTTIRTSSAPPTSTVLPEPPEPPPTPEPEPEPVSQPEIISPAPGSVLSGESVTFQWTDNGTSVSQWYYRIGSKVGAQEFANLRIANPAINSRTFSGLPVDGSRLYVQFSFKSSVTGQWTVTTVEYIASSLEPDAPEEPGTPEPTPDGDTPAIVSPIPGTVLSGSAVNFQWTSNGVPVQQWYFRIGDTLGGEEYTSTRIVNASQSAAVFSGLPSDGRQIFVEFSHKSPFDGSWSSQNVVYNTSNSEADNQL